MRNNETGPPSPLDVLVACTLLSRLPLPPIPSPAFARQARAAWAFPLVGVLLAGLAGGAGLVALALGLPPGVAAGVFLAVQIVLTGAMHEDGLADTVDGLWGGWTPVQRLEIMKDSQIGTYGVLALLLSLGLRWIAITALITTGIGALIGAAALSRGLLAALMTALPPARADGLSFRVGKPGWATAAVAFAIGLGVSVFFSGPPAFLAAFLAVVSAAGVGALARARIGGQTGDILGAGQQVAELTFLLVLLATLPV